LTSNTIRYRMSLHLPLDDQETLLSLYLSEISKEKHLHPLSSIIMTFVPMQPLETLNSYLSAMDGGTRWSDLTVHARVEAFSCRKSARPPLTPSAVAPSTDNQSLETTATTTTAVLSETGFRGSPLSPDTGDSSSFPTFKPSASSTGTANNRVIASSAVTSDWTRSTSFGAETSSVATGLIAERLPAIISVMNSIYQNDGFDFRGVLSERHVEAFDSAVAAKAELDELLRGVSSSIEGDGDDRKTAASSSSTASSASQKSISDKIWRATLEVTTPPAKQGLAATNSNNIHVDSSASSLEVFKLRATNDIDPIPTGETACTADYASAAVVWSRHYFVYSRKVKLLIVIVVFALRENDA
jgi:hypothetical protein